MKKSKWDTKPSPDQFHHKPDGVNRLWAKLTLFLSYTLCMMSIIVLILSVRHVTTGGGPIVWIWLFVFWFFIYTSISIITLHIYLSTYSLITLTLLFKFTIGFIFMIFLKRKIHLENHSDEHH